MTVSEAIVSRVRGLIAAESAARAGGADHAGAGHGDESLTRLCRAAARELAVDGVGITVMINSDTQGVAAASDAFGAAIEDLQFGLGEGPGRDVHDRGQPVLVPDLAAQAGFRWPAYTPAALRAGVGAVFAFPLRVGAVRLGVLSLYQRRTGALDRRSVDLALGFAEVALLTLVDGHGEGLGDELVLGGLGQRLEVYQAQGMVQVQLGVEPAVALARLRAYAYAHDRPLGDVARDVLTRRLVLERDDREGRGGCP